MEGYRTVDNEMKNHVVYRSIYEMFQLLSDHRMFIEMKLCWEFPIEVRDNDDEGFLCIHYEILAKLSEKMPLIISWLRSLIISPIERH